MFSSRSLVDDYVSSSLPFCKMLYAILQWYNLMRIMTVKDEV